MSSLAEIQFVEFGLYSDEDHLAQSNVLVTSNNMAAAGVSGPVHGSLCDSKLGTTDYEYRCGTCYKDKPECPGHPGHMELHCPLLQPIGIPETRRWLKILCHGCSRPIVGPAKYSRLPPRARFAEAASAPTEGKMCGYQDCKQVHPKIIQEKEDNFTLLVQPAGSTQRTKLYPHAIAQIFDRVRDEDVLLLGKSLENHPRKLVMTKYIQIPPITIRPPVRGSQHAGGASNNDINGMLQHLITRNKSIKQELILRGEIDENLDKTITNFQQFYYDLIQGSTAVATVGSTGKRAIIAGSKPVMSFLKMQSRKQGRIRSNLLRKKVTDICRQTISGNSQLSMESLLIPLAFARTLRVFEHVQEFNKDHLMTYFLNGHKRYPGCSRLYKRSDGKTYKMENLRKDITLEVGDIIERDIVTGDVCIFNRQPSLEICSMGCHRVVVNEDPSQGTIQFNVIDCSFYNADFDGDEMNCFFPKDPMTRIEIMNVSHVSNFFISTKNSSPQNGQVQDSNIGCALLTMAGKGDGINMDRFHAMCLFKIPGARLPQLDSEKTAWTGRDVVSVLLQKTPINFAGKPTFYNDNFVPFMDYHPSDSKTVIKNGVMLQGVLDKKSVGPKANRGVFHTIAQNYGNRAALTALYEMQQLVLAFLQYQGFTVSTSDILLPVSARDQLQQLVDQVLIESRAIDDDLMEGKITPPITMTTHEFYEKKQMNALKIKDEDVLRVLMANIRPHDNSLFRIIATGSKGIVPNMIHIMASLQQITINGERIQPSFGHSRALPYFGKFATEAEAYGFIKNPYIVGMNASEFMFACMHGRFDLINKALSTSSTGHHFRKSYMILQAIIIDYFRRAAKHSKVVQILYGDDGLDSRHTERVDFFTIALSDQELRERVGASHETPRSQKAVARILKDRDLLRKTLLRMESGHFNRPFDSFLSAPLSVQRVIDQVLNQRQGNPKNTGSLDKKLDAVKEFCHDLQYIFFNERIKLMRYALPKYFKMATLQIRMLIRMYLSPKALDGISEAELDVILALIEKHYTDGLVQYGDMISAKAAQAICEPLTQHFLDSHHRSVAGGTSKSSLDQIKQLFSDRDISREVNTRMLLRVADPALRYDKSRVQEIANRIEYIDLKRFVRSRAVLFEGIKNLRYPPFKSDREWMDDYFKTSPFAQTPSDLSNWCIRFELSKITMVLKGVSLDTILEQLRFHPHVFILSSKETHDRVFLRAYVQASLFDKKTTSEEARIMQLMETLMDTRVRGIRGISNVDVKSIIRHSVAADGGLSRDSKEFAIETTGANIADILLNDDIDKNTMISTSIRDTYRVYGIEAARQKLINEIIRFMEDNVPNERHIKIYADEMTLTGAITSIERKGMTIRDGNNVLLRAAYSAPSQVFSSAALDNVKGPVHGLSANRLLGGTPRIGTLYSRVSVDEEFVRENALDLNKVADTLLEQDFQIPVTA
jgi:DNA-directed RNA polymerase II subunit RPB1